jgi:DNA polymerase
MGIVSWRRRLVSTVDGSAQRAPEPDVVTAVACSPVGLAAVEAPTLQALRERVAACQGCVLHETRTQTVFGTGATDARLMIIGEAPGAEEDARGEPFVGRAGALLNAMLAAVGLAREVVYITNMLKCRPPRNRDPMPVEVAACGGYLDAQIAQVDPEVILAVGRIAAQSLLQVTTPIGKLRGQEHVHPGSGRPLLVTYHPAYLLRSPREKRKAWSDLCRLQRRLQQDRATPAQVSR